MKTKELEYDEFLEYMKKNGITLAKNNKKFYDVPVGTKLYFDFEVGLIKKEIEDIYLSTYDSDTENKNRQFKYKFDYQWLWDSYKGKFIIQSQETKEELMQDELMEDLQNIKVNNKGYLIGVDFAKEGELEHINEINEAKEETWIYNNHEELKNEFIEENSNEFKEYCKKRFKETK